MLEYVSKQLKDPAEFYSKVAYLYEHKNETSREEIEFIDGRYFDRYSSYMTSADGKYIGRIWFFRDITHRKLMEQKLNEQKNLMSAVYNSMSNIVFVLGSDGTILNDLSSTSKGLFGISKQVIGKQINAILPMNLADKVHATINETLSNNKSSLLEFELEQKGTKKHYHIEFSPLDKDRVVANAIDDTEQYTLLTAIQESNQTKNLLFSIIAHDLRNPIGTIQGYANLINDHFDRRDILSSEDLVTSVKGLKISGEAAFELLEQLMNWCQLQMGNVTYNPKPIPVTKLIEQSYHPLIPSANLKSIIIENNLKDNLSVYVDIPSMELVIRNLTNNAIKYTNKGGRIVYDAYLDEKDTNVCEIVVHDNGIGMSQDIINKLHNRIKTTKDSRQGTAGEKGTNLGFYLAEEYVKLNHGEIYVESPGEGLGSIIRVKLPVYKHTENI